MKVIHPQTYPGGVPDGTFGKDCPNCQGNGQAMTKGGNMYVCPDCQNGTIPMEHTKDSDCRVSDVDQSCADCCVYHGAACAWCGKRAFHDDDCKLIDEAAWNRRQFKAAVAAFAEAASNLRELWIEDYCHDYPNEWPSFDELAQAAMYWNAEVQAADMRQGWIKALEKRFDRSDYPAKS